MPAQEDFSHSKLRLVFSQRNEIRCIRPLQRDYFHSGIGMSTFKLVSGKPAYFFFFPFPNIPPYTYHIDQKENQSVLFRSQKDGGGGQDQRL